MNGVKPLIKVCGITKAHDMEFCARLGADMVGFIFHPDSPRFVGPYFPETADCKGLTKVGVFVKQSVESVVDIMNHCGLDLAQLHGGQDEDFCRGVGAGRVVKVLWPERYDSLEVFQADLDRFRPVCRYFLFDAGTGGGGHGRTIGTDYLRRARIDHEWMLAGGLSPENVESGYEAFDPHGLDVNSGVESAPGIKDETKLRALFEAVARMKK